MPLTSFLCQAGKVAIKDCLESCPLEERCLSLPTLYSLADNREYKPPYRFSTTQLLNGTRMEYLKITVDYGVKPKQRGFLLLGTRHHQRLEAVAKKLGMDAEKKLEGEITGVLDLLQPINGGDTWEIVDYKTVGAYSVAKMLATPPDYGTYALQLNNYRIMASRLGFDIKRLWIQYTVRDGGIKAVARYNLPDQIGLIQIPIYEDDKVMEYFLTKEMALRQALENRILPSLCSYEDNWAGKRCASYCEVNFACPEGSKMIKGNNHGSIPKS